MRLLLLVGPLAVLTGANCARNGTLSPAKQAQWTRDSLEYERRLAKWIFDSTAIDSVVREIRTDSLAHLYESMFASATPVKELQLITCEEDRIGRRYGAVPGLRVISHVRDSMYEKVGGAVVAQTQARMPRSGRLSSGACPKDHAPVVSMTPGGTSLDVRLYRPRAPKRP